MMCTRVCDSLKISYYCSPKRSSILCHREKTRAINSSLDGLIVLNAEQSPLFLSATLQKAHQLAFHVNQKT